MDDLLPKDNSDSEKEKGPRASVKKTKYAEETKNSTSSSSSSSSSSSMPYNDPHANDGNNKQDQQALTMKAVGDASYGLALTMVRSEQIGQEKLLHRLQPG